MGPVSKGISRPLAEVEALANEFAQTFFGGRHGNCKYLIVGSLIRQDPYCRDIDFMTDMDLVELAGCLTDAGCDVSSGNTKRLIGEWNGITFNIFHAEDSYWGATLFYLTGPKGYSIGYRSIASRKGLKLNQYGLFDGETKIAGHTEEEIYEALGKVWKAPELRGK